MAYLLSPSKHKKNKAFAKMRVDTLTATGAPALTAAGTRGQPAQLASSASTRARAAVA
jgi:hypothetical protein